MLDPSASRITPAQASDAQQAQGARSSVVLLTLAGMLWLLAGLLDAITSAVAWLEASDQLTQTEITLSAASAIAVLMTPGALWYRHHPRQVWPSNPRAIETADGKRINQRFDGGDAGLGGVDEMEGVHFAAAEKRDGLARGELPEIRHKLLSTRFLAAHEPFAASANRLQKCSGGLIDSIVISSQCLNNQAKRE